MVIVFQRLRVHSLQTIEVTACIWRQQGLLLTFLLHAYNPIHIPDVDCSETKRRLGHVLTRFRIVTCSRADKEDQRSSHPQSDHQQCRSDTPTVPESRFSLAKSYCCSSLVPWDNATLWNGASLKLLWREGSSADVIRPSGWWSYRQLV